MGCAIWRGREGRALCRRCRFRMQARGLRVQVALTATQPEFSVGLRPARHGHSATLHT